MRHGQSNALRGRIHTDGRAAREPDGRLRINFRYNQKERQKAKQQDKAGKCGEPKQSRKR